MVASGLGISIVPFQSVARETRGGSLSVARIDGTDAGARDRVGAPAVERVPRMVREMMDTLTRILPRLRLAPPGGHKRAASKEPETAAAS